MSWRYIRNLVVRTIKEWLEDDAMTYSAALAFYFVLSLPALLLFSVSVGSIFLRSKSLQDTILNYLQGVIDEGMKSMIVLLFERIPEIDSLSISALIGLVLLLWSASNFFRQFKNFLEKAWGIKPAESNTIKDYIRDTIKYFLIVIFLGGLLMISIIVEGILYTVSRFSKGLLPFSPVVEDYTGSIASFLILVLFFMVLYRVLPNIKLNLKSLFVGSLVTVILITIGKYAIALYFTYSDPISIYGAIGSITGLFLLIYYSTIMVTIGAEFTKVYSES